MKPLAIDLFCGLGGWTEGLLAEGYFECLEDHFKEIGDTALWAMSCVDADRTRAALRSVEAPSPPADAVRAKLEIAANIALAIDSGRGNEKEIAMAIRRFAEQGYWTSPDAGGQK